MSRDFINKLTETEKLRFWSKVKIGADSDCWEWQNKKTFGGYGQLKIRGKDIAATHVALAVDGRPRVDGLHALHACDNRGCCNPRHLRWGTPLENSQDQTLRNRTLIGEKNHQSKLTKHDVLKIRQDMRKQSEIAAHYGVTQAAISLIFCRKKWGHVA